MTMLNLALALAQKGISTIPILGNGSKRPPIQWKEYQSRTASPDEMRDWFESFNEYGLAAICGAVSDGLEDLDLDDASYFDPWCDLVRRQPGGALLLDRLYIQRTPRPGFSISYRWPGAEGNQKLASKADGTGIFETRGEGGYFILAGGPDSVHPSGKPYVIVRGLPTDIPMITAEERQLLHDCARSFDESEPDPKEYILPGENTVINGFRPGDDFNRRASWEGILLPSGCEVAKTSGVETMWKRPGDTKSEYGLTTNWKGLDILHCFTTSFEPFKAGKNYTKFHAYTLLRHKGNFSDAARALMKEGYGSAVRSASANAGSVLQFPATPAQDPESSPKERDPYVEMAPSFLDREDPPVIYLIEDLIPQGVIVLQHGEPRTKKSWSLLEQCIAIATGTPAYELERFAVSSPVPVLYCSQEDSARNVRIRAKALLRARGITKYPETLAFAVHKGINLDSGEWQIDLIKDILKYGFLFVAFDPIRRFAPSADKGPNEVKTTTGFLRQITIATGATVSIAHHDVKPMRDTKDDRRRGHRASGGDWFASAECPIILEAVSADTSLVFPEDYKFSTDPSPFKFCLQTDDPKNPTSARLIGESTSTDNAKDLALFSKICNFLSDNSAGASGSAIAKGIRARKQDVLDALDQLFTDGKVDATGSGARGAKKVWFLTKSIT